MADPCRSGQAFCSPCNCAFLPIAQQQIKNPNVRFGPRDWVNEKSAGELADKITNVQRRACTTLLGVLESVFPSVPPTADGELKKTLQDIVGVRSLEATRVIRWHRSTYTVPYTRFPGL